MFKKEKLGGSAFSKQRESLCGDGVKEKTEPIEHREGRYFISHHNLNNNIPYMNGEKGVSSSIRGRHKAISNYRRRWIIFNTRMVIHKIGYISSFIEVPPFRLSIGMRIRHLHSYKDFSSIKAQRENKELAGEKNDGK